MYNPTDNVLRLGRNGRIQANLVLSSKLLSSSMLSGENGTICATSVATRVRSPSGTTFIRRVDRPISTYFLSHEIFTGMRTTTLHNETPLAT